MAEGNARAKTYWVVGIIVAIALCAIALMVHVVNTFEANANALALSAPPVQPT